MKIMATAHRVVLACFFLTLVSPQEATAGGWWSLISVDYATVAVGQRAKARADVNFTSFAEAERARAARLYLYALRGLEFSPRTLPASVKDWRSVWSPQDADAVRLARMTVRVYGFRARAYVSFAVPDLAPGTYDLMICDAGCAHPLGDVVPTRGFTVVADPATARVAARLDRVEQRLARQARLRAAAQAVARRADARSRALYTRLGVVERRLAQAAEVGGLSPWVYAGWAVAAALMGVVLVPLLRRCRSSKGRLSDDDLRELLSSDAPPASPIGSLLSNVEDSLETPSLRR